MGLRILLLCVVLLPASSSAEIYKWKDTNGVIRYSDVPPPSNVKQEALQGKKIPRPTGLVHFAPNNEDVTTALSPNITTTEVKAKLEGKTAEANAKDEAAKKRAKEAEQLKRDEEQRKAELETKQANCLASKQNLATFTNGGRISKTDENGNKHFLGDADIDQGRADAQKDVEKYCE